MILIVNLAVDDVKDPPPVPPEAHDAFWWLQVASGPVVALIVGAVTIVVVGMAGRRREAEVQLNRAHHELTSERTDAARDRLFRQNRKDTELIPDYGRDASRPINDYFTLMYAVEASAVAVKAFCSTSSLKWRNYLRGVLPRERAEFLAWHLEAVTQTIEIFRERARGKPRLPIGIAELDDTNVHAMLEKHYATLREYGLLPEPDKEDCESQKDDQSSSTTQAAGADDGDEQGDGQSR